MSCHTYLPPEWAPQSGVMLTWPHEKSDWAPILDRVEPVFTDIARQVARFEKVLIACYDDRHRTHVAKLLKATGVPENRLVFGIAPSNDTWARDHGPITVQCQDEPILLDFGFNGWGGKYAHDLDDGITRALYRQDVFGKSPLQTVNLILEGGSIEVDGSGTLLTTERCLLAPTRNSGVSRVQIEKNSLSCSALIAFCGSSTVILPATTPTATSTRSRACAMRAPSPTLFAMILRTNTTGN